VPPIANVPACTATGDEHARARVAVKTMVLSLNIDATLPVPPKGKPQRFARGVPPCRADAAPAPRVRSGTVSGRSVRVSGGVIPSRVLWIVLVAVSVAAVAPPAGASAGGQRCGPAGAVRRIAGMRAVIVRLSETEALVIESHRRSRWSERWPLDASGFSILRVDPRLDTVFGIGSSTSLDLVPIGEHALDVVVSGESLVADGVRVTVVGSAAVDQVRIEPA
jgi:hypothetical protein